MAGILDIPVPEFNEIYWHFRIEYDSAVLDPSEYWTTVARKASRTLSPDAISALIEIDSRSWSHPAPVMPQWATQLRAAGLRIAILSNMPVPVRDYIVQCSWLPQFDSRTFSCDVHICKPVPAIYEHCLENLSAKPSEVLFLDDKEPNVRAAEAFGLHSVLFTNVSSLGKDLKDRFSIPVPLEYSAPRE